jgi:hypothetical protein
MVALRISGGRCDNSRTITREKIEKRVLHAAAGFGRA